MSSVLASEQRRSSGAGLVGSGNGASGLSRRANPARVVDGWLTVRGCRVARVPEPGVIAFHDRDKRRCSEWGDDQPSCTLQELVEAVEGAA